MLGLPPRRCADPFHAIGVKPASPARHGADRSSGNGQLGAVIQDLGGLTVLETASAAAEALLRPSTARLNARCSCGLRPENSDFKERTTEAGNPCLPASTLHNLDCVSMSSGSMYLLRTPRG